MSERYGVLLIDPPWAFRVWGRALDSKRSAESHYPTLSAEALLSLPMQKLMKDSCAVFMWATMPHLPEALALGAAWGLVYKTVAFVWVKANRSAMGRWTCLDEEVNWFTGMGYWTRANAEIVLLFTRGSTKRLSKKVKQVVVAPVSRHSEKPDEVQRRIEQLIAGPYVEVFARRQRPGWAAIGNEIDGRDIREVLAEW